MKKWIVKNGVYNFSGLTSVESPPPQPGPGEVRIKVKAASLNYRDLMVIQQPLWRADIDLVPIADGTGVVDAVGAGVTEWKNDDTVINLYMRDFYAWPPHPEMGMGMGAGSENGWLSEYVVLPAQRLVRAPKSLTPVEAATIPCAAHTAWTALMKLSQARPGDTVLILGTGGVALFALQFASKLGINTIITTSQEDKRQRLLDLGAHAVVNYRDDVNWGKTVNGLTAGGVDKVINTAGVGSLNQAMAALKFGGNVVTVGMITKSEEDLDEYALLGKGLTLHGMPVGGRDGLIELIAFIDATGLKPIIHEVVAFDDAPKAYDAQQSKDIFGKVVVKFY